MKIMNFLIGALLVLPSLGFASTKGQPTGRKAAAAAAKAYQDSGNAARNLLEQNRAKESFAERSKVEEFNALVKSCDDLLAKMEHSPEQFINDDQGVLDLMPERFELAIQEKGLSASERGRRKRIKSQKMNIFWEKVTLAANGLPSAEVVDPVVQPTPVTGLGPQQASADVSNAKSAGKARKKKLAKENAQKETFENQKELPNEDPDALLELIGQQIARSREVQKSTANTKKITDSLGGLLGSLATQEGKAQFIEGVNALREEAKNLKTASGIVDPVVQPTPVNVDATPGTLISFQQRSRNYLRDCADGGQYSSNPAGPRSSADVVDPVVQPTLVNVDARSEAKEAVKLASVSAKKYGEINREAERDRVKPPVRKRDAAVGIVESADLSIGNPSSSEALKKQEFCNRGHSYIDMFPEPSLTTFNEESNFPVNLSSAPSATTPIIWLEDTSSHYVD